MVRWLLVTALLTLFLGVNLGCAPTTQPGDDVKVTGRVGKLPGGPPSNQMPRAPGQ